MEQVCRYECDAAIGCLDFDPIAFGIQLFEAGPFFEVADHTMILSGARAQVEFGDLDLHGGLIDEVTINPHGGARRPGDLRPARRFAWAGFLDRDLFDDLDDIVAAQAGDYLAIDVRLSTHIDVFLGHVGGTRLQRGGRARLGNRCGRWRLFRRGFRRGRGGCRIGRELRGRTGDIKRQGKS